MKRALVAVLAVVVGLAFGVSTFVWLVPDLQLAIVLGGTYGLGVWLYGEWGDVLRAGANDWQTNRWRIASTSFMLIVAFFGFGPAISIPLDARLPIQLLLLGAAWVGMLLGVASVSDRPNDQTASTDADASKA